ncbi:hypothetical protein NQZ68_001608 [Dissostichus eleginoides]|nr:hypothetical protein NQZ68_001608 [Dissostichus eleginoides]
MFFCGDIAHATVRRTGSIDRNIALWPRSEPPDATVVYIPNRQSVTIDALIMDLQSRGFFRGHRSCQ